MDTKDAGRLGGLAWARKASKRKRKERGRQGGIASAKARKRRKAK